MQSIKKQPFRAGHIFLTTGFLLLLLILLFTGSNSTQAVPGPVNGDGSSNFIAKWIDPAGNPVPAVCDAGWHEVPPGGATNATPVGVYIAAGKNTEFPDSIGMAVRGTDNYLYYQNCSFSGSAPCTWASNWTQLSGATVLSAPFTYVGSAWDIVVKSTGNQDKHNINWGSGWQGWFTDNSSWVFGTPTETTDAYGNDWEFRRSGSAVQYRCGDLTPLEPDLVTNHQAITINGSRTVGTPLTFTSTVKNQGAGPAGTESQGRFCIDNTNCLNSTTGRVGGDIEFGPFTSGLTSSPRTSSGWTPTVAKTYTVYWCADVTKIISESNESNNCHSRTFTVGAPALPSAPVVTFSCPAPGTTGTVSWSGISGATHYDVRVDDLENGWNPVCSSPLAGDYCQTGVTGTSFPFTSVPGNTYDVWARAVNNAGPGPESAIVTGTCIDSRFTLDTAGGIEVSFSPALTSESTETTISVNPVSGFTAAVSFSVIDILNDSGVSIGVSGIPGFDPSFIPTTLAHPYTGGTMFSVKVSVTAADPNNDQLFTVVVRGSGGGKTAIVNVPLTLKASNPGFEEQ